METLHDWLITFGMIMVKPFPQTFVTEAKKAEGKFTTAVAWITIVTVLTDFQTMLLKNYFSLSKILKSMLFPSFSSIGSISGCLTGRKIYIQNCFIWLSGFSYRL